MRERQTEAEAETDCRARDRRAGRQTVHSPITYNCRVSIWGAFSQHHRKDKRRRGETGESKSEKTKKK